MKRILTVAFVVLAGAMFADQSHGQYGYGYGGGYAPAPAYGPNPYGVSPHDQAAHSQTAYGSPYSQAGYAPPQFMPAAAPVAYPPQYAPMPGPVSGPMPAYPGAGYTPAAYAQPPVPTPAGPSPGMPGPMPSYGGETIITDPGYGSPSYGGDFCSSCGANCGACECGTYGHGGCSPNWCYSPLRNAFGSLELINWYRHGVNLPPLVTTSPQGTVRADAGDLSVNTTRVLFGNDRVEDAMTGIRFTIGTWLDPNKEYGLVYRLSAPGTDEVNYSLSSDNAGIPTIAIPFFNVDLAQEDALLVAFNDPVNGTLATGNVNVSVENEIINHDLYTLLMIRKGCGWRTDLLLGYQNTRIEETLTVSSFSTAQSALFVPGFAVGTTFDTVDVLSVENDFHGGTIGLVSELQQGPWTFRFLGKLAIGGTTSTATVSGRTITTEPTVPPTVSTAQGGLFTQASNIGTFEANSFSISPEATLTLGYNVSPNVRLTAGYTFMYWTHVVPVNGIIDRNVSPSQAVASPVPVITGDTDFWVMGYNLGAEYRY